MKKQIIKKLSLIAALAGLACSQASISQASEQVPLIAGQHFLAGTVHGMAEDDYIYVVYETTSDWVITEMHVAVGPGHDSFPVNKKGNPKIGNFPYQVSTSGGVSYYVFQIPNEWPGEETICIAAHAVVKPSPTAPSGLREQTAWAAGEPFNAGSWASYFCVLNEED